VAADGGAARIGGVRANSITAINNWNSHRLKIIGLIGIPPARFDPG